MNKIATFVLLVAVVSILSSCGSKKAEPINLPDATDIESVKITHNNQTFEKIDSDWISELVKQVGTGEPTAKKSVQDVPNVAEYIKIDLVLKNGNTSTLFIYQEKNKWYIEQPYQGIYLANDTMIEMINSTD